MANYYLGVDGGGTKTDVLCADELGVIVGQSTAGPTNLTSTSVGAASFNLIEGIRQATQSLPSGGIEEGGHVIAHLAMGLAGLDTQREHERAQEVFARALQPYSVQKMTLVNDSIIALENATDAPNAVVLISGTGSICFGRNDQGKTAKTSGVDFLLADQGSGYSIGLHVLREAVKSFDGRQPKSVLEDLVVAYFHLPSLDHLKEKVYDPLLTKIEIANLAPVCFAAVEKGDQVAQLIVEHAVGALVLQAETVIHKLDLAQKAFDCVFAGSILGLPQVKESVLSQLQAKFPSLVPKIPDKTPVYGALKLALKKPAL